MKVKYAIAGLMFTAGSAMAAQILPDASGFGAIPGATFGGTGIPNDAVAQSSAGGITVGLTAHSRFGDPPAVTNNGAGTFTAVVGTDLNAPSPGNPYGEWNFGYYLSGIPSGAAAALYTVTLAYDFNPAAGNDETTHGRLVWNGGQMFLPTNNAAYAPAQNSLNLGMDFLATSLNAAGVGVFAPGGSFDPNVEGQYTFRLSVFNAIANAEVTSTSMLVNVVPEPGEWAMMLAGLGAVGLIARRRQSQKA